MSESGHKQPRIHVWVTIWVRRDGAHETSCYLYGPLIIGLTWHGVQGPAEATERCEESKTQLRNG